MIATLFELYLCGRFQTDFRFVRPAFRLPVSTFALVVAFGAHLFHVFYDKRLGAELR